MCTCCPIGLKVLDVRRGGGAADRESRERKRNARTYVEVGDLFVEGFGLVTREDVLHLLRYAFQKSLVNS